jgi:3-isopropylmalate/(R)-2-methylmalate dehydratase large subunit
MAPKGPLWDQAMTSWRTLFDERDAQYDRVISINASELRPQVTWGNSPQDVVTIEDAIPEPSAFADEGRRSLAERALDYMGLTPGQPIEGTPIDIAFIGSCTNGRLSDLQAAAEVVRGRKVAPGVRALAVPGGARVKVAAEALGLHTVFQEAGFEWREAGCSMCVGAGGDFLSPGQRSISTSNRNFEGRQGPASRTHLASPAMVAAAAIAGCITDVRKMLS